MSTNVSRASHLDPDVNVIQFANYARRELGETLTRGYHMLAVEKAVEGLVHTDGKSFVETLKEVLNDREAVDSWASDLPSLTFLYDEVEGELYSVFHLPFRLGGYREADEAQELLSSLRGVIGEFDYSNSTDEQVETLGEEEWHHRGDVWRRVAGNKGLRNYGVYAELVDSIDVKVALTFRSLSCVLDGEDGLLKRFERSYVRDTVVRFWLEGLKEAGKLEDFSAVQVAILATLGYDGVRGRQELVQFSAEEVVAEAERKAAAHREKHPLTV